MGNLHSFRHHGRAHPQVVQVEYVSQWGEKLQKNNRYFGQCFIGNRTIFGGALQSVGPNATMCDCGRPRPRPEGPGTHCRPRLPTTENHMLKAKELGSRYRSRATGRCRGDRAVSMCPSPSPGPSSPQVFPSSLQADVRDHVAKANSCKRGLDMVPRNLDSGLVIVQSTDRNRSNLCNRRPPCRASLLSHPSMPK